jgi:hypothetical protein
VPDAGANEIPDGAAVFPLIPGELGVNPLLLAAIHALVFLAGSDDEIVNPDAAVEAVETMALYLQRLDGDSLTRVREDLACLTSYAKQADWPKQTIRALANLLSDCGVDVDEKK